MVVVEYMWAMGRYYKLEMHSVLPIRTKKELNWEEKHKSTAAMLAPLLPLCTESLIKERRPATGPCAYGLCGTMISKEED